MKKLKKGYAATLTAAMLLGTVSPVYAQSEATAGAAVERMSLAVPGGSAADARALVDAAVSGGNSGAEGVAPVDTKISRERAIELAKQFVQVPEGYKLQNVNYQSLLYSAGANRGSWNLNFTKQDKNRFYGSINVSIDADNGKLLSFYIGENNPDKKPVFPPKVQLEQAKQLAADFVAKMSPEYKDLVQYDDEFEKNFRTPLGGHVQYPVRFNRVVNGIPFPLNSISVTVDDTGSVISYQVQWDEKLQFSSPGTVLTQEQADASFKKQLKPELQYILPYNSKETPAPLLAYDMSTFMIDAESGAVVGSDGTERTDSPSWVPVIDKALAELPSASLKLTREQAIERATSLLPIPKDAKLEGASYHENTNPQTGTTQAQWELQWSSASGEDKGQPNVHASIDSDTGAIVQFSRYSIRPLAANDSAAAPLTDDALKEKAVQYVKQWLPAYAHQLYYVQEAAKVADAKRMAMSDYGFTFRRMINGAFTEYDSVSVSLNRKTGELQYFHSNLSNYTYPDSLPKTITADEAKALLLGQYRLQLQYVIDPNNNGFSNYYGASIPIEKYNLMVAAGEIKPEASTGTPTTRLVYSLLPVSQLRGPVFLDAVTGEWKNRENGNVVKPLAAAPTDITGHWAEIALRLMLEYQALDVSSDGKVQPDKGITRGEMVKMLLLSLNGGYDAFPAGAYAERAASFSDVAKSSPYYGYIENAVDRNLLDRSSDAFRPDEVLTRAELSDLIVRALGYGKLTETEGLFVNPATDVTGVKNQANVALVTALGIMSAEGGLFAPTQQVTRAQAAAAFYKFLQKRMELQDSL